MSAVSSGNALKKFAESHSLAYAEQVDLRSATTGELWSL
jgi:hypothetical protein